MKCTRRTVLVGIGFGVIIAACVAGSLLYQHAVESCIEDAMKSNTHIKITTVECTSIEFSWEHVVAV